MRTDIFLEAFLLPFDENRSPLDPLGIDALRPVLSGWEALDEGPELWLPS